MDDERRDYAEPGEPPDSGRHALTELAWLAVVLAACGGVAVVTALIAGVIDRFF
jgi:hypothetical protein